MSNFLQNETAAYRFESPGRYSVALTVSGPDGSDAAEKSDLIVVTDDEATIPSENKLANGTFSDGTTDWQWYTAGTATWTVVNWGGLADIGATGGNTQLYQPGIPVTDGQRYRFGAQMFSEEGEVEVTMRVMMHDSPYSKLINEVVVVTPEMQVFEFVQPADFTNDNMRVTLMLNSPGKLYVDNVFFAVRE